MTWDWTIKITDIIMLIAVLIGPIVAVAITLWYQTKKQKYDAKERLFLTLMAHRKSFPPSYDLVNGLNLIDVVFASHPKVVALWHEYYGLLYTPNSSMELGGHKYIDMLSEMASVLGYETLKQTDIEKFYTPVAHGNQAEINDKIQKEWLRVLENSHALMMSKEPDKNPENPYRRKENI